MAISYRLAVAVPRAIEGLYTSAWEKPKSYPRSAATNQNPVGKTNLQLEYS